MGDEKNKKQEQDDMQGVKKPKRQSVINDFTALEKTCQILGLSRTPVYIPEEEENPIKKKRHSSEGKKQKNKTKNKKKELQNDDEKSKTKKEVIAMQPALGIVEKKENEAKRNFFQDIINQKKGLV